MLGIFSRNVCKTFPINNMFTVCISVMFWSETGDKAQIKRAGMDGSNRQVLVRGSLHWPVGLAADLLQNRLYWTDEKLRCIGSATLDGDDVKVNFSHLLV